jgi:hypothetical protein
MSCGQLVLSGETDIVKQDDSRRIAGANCCPLCYFAAEDSITRPAVWGSRTGALYAGDESGGQAGRALQEPSPEARPAAEGELQCQRSWLHSRQVH